MISVSLVQMGRETVAYTLEDDAAVGDLMEADGREYEDGELTLNQRTVNDDTILRDGDRVLLAKVVKGNLDAVNPFDVELYRLAGGHNISLPAVDGMTIKQLLDQLSPEDKAQFFKADGKPAYEYRIVEAGNRTTIAQSLEHTLIRPANGAKLRILCAQMVKGN